MSKSTVAAKERHSLPVARLGNKPKPAPLTHATPPSTPPSTSLISGIHLLNNDDVHVIDEARRQARLWYWASFLSERGFTVNMNSKGSLRAVCVGCGRKYDSRFKFAKQHIDRCPMPPKEEVFKTGDVIGSITLPRQGDKLEIAWVASNGRRVRAVAEITEVNR